MTMAHGSAEPAVTVRGLTKRYGAFTAVNGIDLDVARGEVFGFLGPNGSGKTTTIRMLTGSIGATGGTAYVLGEDVLRHPDRVRPRIGYMSQKFSLFTDLTVGENLDFYAGAYAVPTELYADRRASVLDLAGLHGRENELVRNLSVGIRQRLALGTATLHDPEVLFLDEPTSGVDPVARRAFWDILHDLAGRGVTLFVTTHYMEEASNCTRLALMYRGSIVADGSPTDLRRGLSGRTIYEIRTPSARLDDVGAWLTAQPGIDEVYAAGSAVHAVFDTTSTPAPAPDVLAWRLGEVGFPHAEVTPVEATMEDVFVTTVTAHGDPR